MIKVIIDSKLVEQFRLPHSKKKRIRKKWAKRPENFRPISLYDEANLTLYCHPSLEAKARNKLALDREFADYMTSSIFGSAVLH